MNQFTLGQHDANIRAMMEGMEEMHLDQAAMRKDIAEIKEILAEKRGERRVAMWVAGGAGVFGSAFFALLKHYAAGMFHP